MNTIKLNGPENDVYKKLAALGLNNSCDAEQIITFLKHNKNLLCSEEAIETSMEMPPSLPGMMSLVIMRKNLYVNLKLSTILIVALLLDIHITAGFAQMLTAMMGISGHAIVTFGEENGEKCIIKETLRTQDKVGHPDMLSKFHGECCNNDLKCRYRVDDKCYCSSERIEEILAGLASCNMFIKTNY